MKRLIVLAVVGLSACANTGPIKIAKDTYSISVRVPFSGPAGAKGEAFQDASEHCVRQNKHMLLQYINAYECALRGGCGEAEITFQCLEESDPRYTTEYTMRKDKGVFTIEHR